MKHGEMGQVSQNPLQRTVRMAHLSVLIKTAQPLTSKQPP